MIQKEMFAVREDGVNLWRTYSDQGMMIKKAGTGEIYAEAVDIENNSFIYTETDIPIDSGEEPTLQDALEMLGELGVDMNDQV